MIELIRKNSKMVENNSDSIEEFMKSSLKLKVIKKMIPVIDLSTVTLNYVFTNVVILVSVNLN